MAINILWASEEKGTNLLYIVPGIPFPMVFQK